MNDRLIYKKKKFGQNPFIQINSYQNTKIYDKMLMKDSSYKVANLQNFLFKIRYNKLLTKANVIVRAEKYKFELNSKYENDFCPCCNLEVEKLEHLATCIEYEKLWTKNNKKILSIINSYSIMSKHDTWHEQWSPLSQKIRFFPIWTNQDACFHFFEDFHRVYGRLALIPENLEDVLDRYKINQNLKINCIYKCYLEILQTLRKCWLQRCKIFAQNYRH